MIKGIGKVAALLFVGVFVLTVAFTITASTTNAHVCSMTSCCEWTTPCSAGKGVEFHKDYPGYPDSCGCTCAPLNNPNQCPLLCPHIC